MFTCTNWKNVSTLITNFKYCTAFKKTISNLLRHLGIPGSWRDICRKDFSRFLCDLETIYEYEYMDNAGIGKHCLILHKPGLPNDVTYLLDY